MARFQQTEYKRSLTDLNNRLTCSLRQIGRAPQAKLVQICNIFELEITDGGAIGKWHSYLLDEIGYSYYRDEDNKMWF